MNEENEITQEEVYVPAVGDYFTVERWRDKPGMEGRVFNLFGLQVPPRSADRSYVGDIFSAKAVESGFVVAEVHLARYCFYRDNRTVLHLEEVVLRKLSIEFVNAALGRDT